MKTIRRLLACLLATLMLMSLTACSGLTDVLVEESVTTLVQGNLDVLYLGKVTDDYLESTVSTKEECLQLYEEGLGMEADFFALDLKLYLNTHPDDERALEMFREACRQLRACKAAFEECCYPLTACSAGHDGCWDWPEGVWPPRSL